MGPGEYDCNGNCFIVGARIKGAAMLTSADLVFYILGGIALVAGLSVVCMSNPVYSALSLAVTMICIGGLFWSLGALFIAAVQLIVYAGAVMVLFVMVLMLFDLKHEKQAFTPGRVFALVKMIAISLLLGLLGRLIYLYAQLGIGATDRVNVESTDATKELSMLLFSRYVFAFEVISILLLVVVVGAVTLSRIKGGTHAKS